jgi:hypothetical protein
MSREEAQRCDRLQRQGARVGDIVLVERWGELSQHHIAVGSRDGRDDARAVAPEVLLAFLGAPVGLLLVGGAFDPDTAVGITCGLAVLALAVAHRLAGMVFFDPAVHVLDIHRDGFA